MIGGVILLLADRRHSPWDVEGATGQGVSLASASGPPLHLLTTGQRLSLRDVEGAAGQGASLTFAIGPPLHLWQLAAATLTEARSKKIKRGLGVGIQIYGLYCTVSYCIVPT